MNLYGVFEQQFPIEMDGVFLETDSGAIYSYKDMHEKTSQIANFLISQDVKKGDRILVQADKSPEVFFLYLACLRCGAIFIPLNPAYKKQELVYFCQDAAPKIIICAPELLTEIDEIAQTLGITVIETLDSKGSGSLIKRIDRQKKQFNTVDCDADDVAVILYTSGTTGKPKGAMLTHHNLMVNGKALKKYWGFNGRDVLLHALPVFHVHGLFFASHCVLLSGARMYFVSKFNLDAVLKYLPKSTVFMGVPTCYTRLLDDNRLNKTVCKNMRLFISGSAPLLEQTFVEFRKRTGFTILERYGMSETGINTSNPLNGERRLKTVGFPLPGSKLRVVSDNGKEVEKNQMGSIEVQGKNVFEGYWRKSKETEEAFTVDHYFKTGDLGMIDDDGYLSIVGRAKDMIITGGLNVYPKEIELCINDLEGVVESAVIGLPHADFGEGVTAIVVSEIGSEIANEKKIIACLKEELANFKIPKRIIFVDALPKNTMGKIQKNELRKKYKTVYNIN